MHWRFWVRNVVILCVLALVGALSLNLTSEADIKSYSKTEEAIRTLKNVSPSDVNIVSAVTLEKEINEGVTLYTAHVYEDSDYIGAVTSERRYDAQMPNDFNKKFHFLLRNNSILIQFKEGLSEKQLIKFLNKRKWRIVEKLPSHNAIIIKVENDDIPNLSSEDIKAGYELEAIFKSYAIALEKKAQKIQTYREVEFAIPELEISKTAKENIYFQKPLESGKLKPLINAWQSTELKTRSHMHGSAMWINAFTFTDRQLMPNHVLELSKDIKWPSDKFNGGSMADQLNMAFSNSILTQNLSDEATLAAYEAIRVSAQQYEENRKTEKRVLMETKFPKE